MSDEDEVDGPTEVHSGPRVIITHSESIAELGAALSKYFLTVENPEKNRTNDNFKADYADLSAVLFSIRRPLGDVGLAFVQFPAYEEGTVYVETLLMHASGQWIRGICSTPVKQSSAQGIGSAITYLRRFCLSAVFGVAGENDDDGNAAVAKEDPQQETIQFWAEKIGRMQTMTALDSMKPDLAALKVTAANKAILGNVFRQKQSEIAARDAKDVPSEGT